MEPFKFKSGKRSVWRVSLPDESKITLTTPKLITIKESSSLDPSQYETDEFVDVITSFTAKVMSGNMEGRAFTPSDVMEMFDAGQIMEFLQAWQEFAVEITTSKN